MKRIVLSTVILLMGAKVVLNAQEMTMPRNVSPGLFQPGTTLQQVIGQLNTNSFVSDTGEGGFDDRLNTFRSFWQYRVAANDTTADSATQSNMFSRYYSGARRAMASRFATGCSSSAFAGNWSLLGPDTLGTQCVGYVNAVWASPTDSNYILAATPGGLFKTTTGGRRHWRECSAKRTRV
jgi:hypothetical protein